MNLLQMSVSGALLILLVFLVRLAALRAVPKRTFLFLWALVLARLLVPFPPVLPLPSLLPAEFLRSGTAATAAPPPASEVQPAPIPTAGREDLPPAPAANPGGTPAAMPAVTAMPAATAAPAQPQGTISAAPVLPTTETTARMARLEQAALIVWLLGMCITAAVFAILYILNYRRFRRAAPLEGPAAEAWLAAHPAKRKLALRSLPALASPLTYGILRPVILLPEGLDPASEEAAYALEHEYVHARRLDALWKLLLAAAAAAHWFNPFVWLMWFLAGRDLELSCDEEVLRRYGTERRGGYARALLAMEEKRSLLPPLHSGFGAGATKERILAIMKYKKATLLSIALAAVLVAALAACALGGRKADARGLSAPGADLTVGPVSWGMRAEDARKALKGAKEEADGSLRLEADFCGVPAVLRWSFAGEEGAGFLNSIEIRFADGDGTRRKAITQALEEVWGARIDYLPAIYTFEPGPDSTELAPEEYRYWRTEDFSDEWHWKSGVTARFRSDTEEPTLCIDASGRNLAEGRPVAIPQSLETQQEVAYLLHMVQGVRPSARTWAPWHMFGHDTIREDYYRLHIYTQDDLDFARRCFAPYPWVTLEFLGDQYEPADISHILLDGSLTPVNAAVPRERLAENLTAVFVNRTEERVTLPMPTLIYAERPEGWVQPKCIEYGFVDFIAEVVEPGASITLNWEYALSQSGYDFVPGRYLLAVRADGSGGRQLYGAMVTITEEGAVPAGTGETVLYRNGAFLLPVPEEYDALLTVETPEDDARGTLFNVTEIASREAGQKLHPGEDWGDGWLFGIRRVSREELGALLSRDMTGMDVFAKDLSGNYYLCTHPSDVRFVPESGESSEEGWQQWMTLCAWIDRALADFIEMNPGVFAETRSQTEADVLLARARYRGEEPVAVSRGEETYDARGFDGWETAAEGLVWNADFTLLDSATAPEGEPVVLSFAVGPPYELRFWPGSDLAALDDGRNESKWYRGTLRASGGETVGDLALGWFEAAAGRTTPAMVNHLSGGFTLPVPEEYDGLLTVETPEDGGILFTLTETASREAGQKLRPGQKTDDGLIASIGRVDEETLGHMLTGQLPGQVFAREEGGDYLVLWLPPDGSHYVPEEGDSAGTDSAHYRAWQALWDWVWQDTDSFLAAILEANPGLTACRRSYTSVDRFLARTLYEPDRGFTLRIGDREGVSPLGTERALAFAHELVWNYGAEEGGRIPMGSGVTSLTLTDPASGKELTFFMDSDMVMETSGSGNTRYYRMAALDGSRQAVGNVVFDWYWNAALTQPGGETVSFLNGSYILSLPAQFAEDLIVEAPESGSVLFRVWEKASHGRWEARGAREGDERNGWLFTLQRLNEGDWGRWLAETTGGAFTFAREDDGHYYNYEYPLWETFAPEGEDVAAERAGDAYFRWMAVRRAVGSEDTAEGFIRDNVSQGLASYRISLADDFLAEIFSGVPAAVRRPGGEGFDPMAKESSARPLRSLLFRIDYRETEAFAPPPAEEAVIFETADGRLSLWPGSDLAVLERWGMTFYYIGEAWLAGSQLRPGDLALECLKAAADVFPDAWAEIDYCSLEELLESSTDVLAARCTREAVRAGDGWDYGFTVLRALKGTTGEGELTVHAPAQRVGATEHSGSFFAGDPDFRAGEEYLLVLERQRSVFFPADRYFAYLDILLPLTGDQAASMYDEPLEKHSAHLRSDSTGETILRYVQDVIAGFAQESPEFYGTDYIEASSLEEAREAAEFILRVEPTRLDAAAGDRELLSCRLLETVKGDLGFLTAKGENQPEPNVFLVFFPGVLELGREYYVCVNQVSPPNGILFVPVSKEHCFYR